MYEFLVAYLHQRSKVQSRLDEEAFYARYAHVPFSGVSSFIGRMTGRIALFGVRRPADAKADSKACALNRVSPEGPDQSCLQQVSR
ncbi:hypothetical protein M8R20_00460 [Pseudomonas sp. R2.Fl]|nr:hypothetical protein [Pseudomonas sp. R2.Fl]